MMMMMRRRLRRVMIMMMMMVVMRMISIDVTGVMIIGGGLSYGGSVGMNERASSGAPTATTTAAPCVTS